MVLSILDSELLSLILYGYSKGIPIIEAAVEKEEILRIIIELHKSPDSKLSINNDRYVYILHKKGILHIIENKYDENKYILSKIGEDIARKLEKEIDIYRKHYYYIDHKNLNLNLDRILKMLCNELIVNYSSVGYRFYPIFQVIYENYNKPALTPKLIGRYGFILSVLYNGENKCYKCKNWALSLKDIKDYLQQLSMNCYNKFGRKIDAKYLSKYNLVTLRGCEGNYRYKLTDKYGYYVSEYIIKNLVVAYKYL